MTSNATPNPTKPGRPARGKKYPAGLAIMLTASQRGQVDGRAAAKGETLGEATRALLADGLVLEAALDQDPELRVDLERMAVEGDVDVSTAIATMLRFAVREADRRVGRNANIAAQLAQSMAKSGVPFDGIDVGGVSVDL